MAISTLLTRLEAAWVGVGAPIVEQLRPGIDREAVRELVREVHVGAPPDEVAELWAWHDGAEYDASGRDHLGPYGLRFLSAADAVASTKHMRALAQTAAVDPQEPEDLWLPSFLTLFKDDAGGHLAVKCGPDPCGARPLWYVNWTMYETIGGPEAESLGEVVGWWTESIEANVWTLDDAGRWWSHHDRRPEALSRKDIV